MPRQSNDVLSTLRDLNADAAFELEQAELDSKLSKPCSRSAMAENIKRSSDKRQNVKDQADQARLIAEAWEEEEKSLMMERNCGKL